MSYDNPYSKKTQKYWHQIRVMTTKLNDFAVTELIKDEEIDEVISYLNKLKGAKRNVVVQYQKERRN